MNYEDAAYYAAAALASDRNQFSDFVRIVRKTGYIVLLKTKFDRMHIKDKKLLLKDSVKVIY